MVHDNRAINQAWGTKSKHRPITPKRKPSPPPRIDLIALSLLANLIKPKLKPLLKPKSTKNHTAM
jgi:hypothetical protein